MKQILIKMLFKLGVVTAISTLRKNENGYWFLTFLGKNGNANNVYFGKESSKIISAKYKAGDNVLAELKTASVVLATNEDGEDRYKISLQGTSEYSGVSALSEMFGVEQDEVDFDVDAFRADFSTNETVPPVEDETDEELAAKLQNKAPKAGARKPAGARK